MKICIRCNQEKNETEFRGNRNQCKTCTYKQYAEYSASPIVKLRRKLRKRETYFIKHDYLLKQKKETSQRIKHDAMVIYGNGKAECICCGEFRLSMLTLDHIAGGGNKHRKQHKYTFLSGWLKAHNYPSGFQTLCSNCNLSKHINGICEHMQSN